MTGSAAVRLVCAAALSMVLAACTSAGNGGDNAVATTGSTPIAGPSSPGPASTPADHAPVTGGTVVGVPGTSSASEDTRASRSGGTPSKSPASSTTSSSNPAVTPTSHPVTTATGARTPSPVTITPPPRTRTSAPTSVPRSTRTSTPPPVTSAPATSAPATSAPATSAPPTADRWWRPTVGLTWQWQLSGTIDLTVDAAVYDLDMFETPAATVSRLHAMKRHVICYVDVGSWEDFRPDAGAFPESVKGASNGWPGERWLDIRQLTVLQPLMTKRLQQCADKGFDGVEPDLMDGFSNTTGFPLSAADQLRYNRMIADVAHSLGLAVGLKGDPEQASSLVGDFDYAINEQCVEYDECALLRPFIAAGKPVFHVEYSLAPAEFCPVTRPLHFSSMRKNLDLDAWREPC